MNPFKRHYITAALILGVSLSTGCTDSLLSSVDSEEGTTGSHSFSDEFQPLLRNAQFMQRARSSNVELGKGGVILQADLFAFVGFNLYQADGLTPRILDEYALTQRILGEYGVTRRVLEEYGITRRVLDEYGVTQRVLDEFGLTQRVLDDYGITQRIMDGYGVSWDQILTQIAAYDSAIKVRTSSDSGVSVWIRGRSLDAILSEMLGDADIKFIEPDPSVNAGMLGFTNAKDDDGQFFPWGVLDVAGGRVTKDDASSSHVYLLDSGAAEKDLKVETRKDFTMLFVNREQIVHEQNNWVNPGFFDPGTDGNPEDENGHGSHVAGTIGAKDNDKGVLGTAPGIKIHSLKVLTAEGQTDVTTLVAAINYVVYQKENIHSSSEQVLINLSVGMDAGTTEMNVLDEAIQGAIASGIVVVVSAGNNGTDVATYSPAHVAEAITVGAYDVMGEFAFFSNHGAGVDILAPGVDVVSLPRTEDEIEDGIRIVRSGTSMATPHVTAAAAVIWAANPSYSPAEVEAALKASAQSGGITNVPFGTTDKTVSLMSMAEDLSSAGNFKLEIKKVEYKKNDNQFILELEGAPLSSIEVRTKKKGVLFATLQADIEGKVGFSEQNSAWIPCEVVISDGVSKTWKKVKGAPKGCKQ